MMKENDDEATMMESEDVDEATMMKESEDVDDVAEETANNNGIFVLTQQRNESCQRLETHQQDATGRTIQNLVEGEIQSDVDTEFRRNDLRANHESKIDDKNTEDEFDNCSVKTSSFNYIPQGFQLKSFYAHSKKLTDLVDVTYNPRTREFIFLDTRGITTWNKDSIHNKVSRGLNYPKYQNKLLVKIIYARKFNVYFCIAKDFSLKVLNMNFEETCNVNSDLSSVMFLIFNPVRDELITGGVKGTMVWEFRQDTNRVWKEIKPMANYALFLQRELKCVGGSWVKKVELDHNQQYLYCCSDTDVLCYDIHGRLVFKLNNAHQSSITGCKYSHQARLLVTCSTDTNVKVWSMTGGHVHTFRGHSKAVTNILLHPDSLSLVLTSSMDGSVRIWSLEIMEMLYAITVSTEGIQWMGLTGENYLWTASKRDLSVWHLNHVLELYTLTRSKITSIKVIHCQGKTSRIVAVGDDSSMRLVSIKQRKNLSTVLPPPNISPLEKILGIAYNREYSLAYLLVTPQKIWVYTMRTDPACRIGMWDVFRLQDRIQRSQSISNPASPLPGKVPSTSASPLLGQERSPQPQLDENSRVAGTVVECSSLTIINMPIMYLGEEGYVCPLKTNFLVLGMQDGRILFMDPMEFGEIHYEFKAYKDAILEMIVDEPHHVLITKCKCRSGALFRFWDLPSLVLKFEVNTDEDTTAYALLDDVFLTGHMTGHLALYQLTELQQTTRLQYGGVELYTQSHQNELVQSKIEHNGGVIAIDSCCQLQMFVSCGEDNVVKIWDKKKITLTELILDGPISSAHFLNVKGDLLIGYKNHLFLINHSKLLSVDSSSADLGSFVESESDIYEDPAVRFEGVAVNPDPINMQQYLVPYNLDFSNKFLEGEITESKKDSDEDHDEDSDNDMSLAPSDIYLSPNGTPRTLSVVDLILNSEFNQQDIDIGLVKFKKKKSNLKMKEVDEFDGEINEFEMPKFGISPGPSPTVTPPSTPEYCSSSEVEDEEKMYEEEITDPQKPSDHPLDVISLIDVQPPKPLPVETPEPAIPEQVSRYSLSHYKIDVKSLMKNSKKVSSKKIVSHKAVDSESEKQDKLNQNASSASKRVIQKKTQKGTRIVAKDRVRSAAKQTTATSSEVPQTEAASVPPEEKQNVNENTKAKVNKTEKTKDVFAKNKEATDTPSGSSIESSSPAVKPGLHPLPPTTNPASTAESRSSSRAQSKASVGKKSSIFTNWRKKKPPSASGTDISGGRESDVLSTISLPDGSLDVVYSPKGKARHGEKSKHEKLTNVKSMSEVKESSAYHKGSKHREKSNDGEKLKRADKLRDERKSKQREESKMSEKSKNKDDSESVIKQAKHNDKGSISIIKAASRLSITEKYSLHKASKRSLSKEAIDTRPRSASVPDDICMQRCLSPSIPSRTTSAASGKPVSPGLATSTSVSPGLATSNSVSPGLEDPSLVEEGHTAWEDGDDLIDSASRPTQTIGTGLKSLMRMQRGSTEEQTDFDGGIATVRSSQSLIHPLFSDMDIYAKSNIVDGTIARPNTAEYGSSRRYSLERPHTVATGDLHVTFQNDELDARYVPRHISCPGSPAEMSRLFKNDGTQFEDNWQDRMIERNLILKFKKEERARVAFERRQLLEVRRRQRQQALMGHHSCSTDNADQQPSTYCMTRSDSSLDILKRDQPSRASALKSPTPPWTPPAPQPRHYKEVNDLSQEKPYRFRLNKDQKKLWTKSMEMFERADGTSGLMLLKRPYTAQSIPSKAKFVLLKPSNPTPRLTPSPLEEHLLMERFPGMRKRIIRHDAFERNITANMMFSNMSYL